MKKVYSLLIAALATVSSYAQVTISGGTTAAGSYGTLAAAITALNPSTITGPVTIDVVAGYSEFITARLNLTATGTAVNSIVFQKSGAGSNPLIRTGFAGTATPTGATPDGIWSIQGSDYITIDGIDLQDTCTINPNSMEYGYGVFKNSVTDGAQNVTIKNCTVTLNRVNNATSTAPMVEGSVGILVINSLPTAAVTALVPTSAAGSNSRNRFYTNTIQNCNYGIAIIGYAAPSPFNLADTLNDIGGGSAATGNVIRNFGGAAGATNPSAGVRTLAQYGINISYNVVNNNDGSGVNHPSTLRGIYTNTATSASETISYNTVTARSGATTSQLAGIENVAGATPLSNTVSINNNVVTVNYPAPGTTGAVYGIYNNSASAANLAVNNNSIDLSSVTTGAVQWIYQSGSSATQASVNIQGNTFTSTGGVATTNTSYIIYNNTACPLNNVLNNSTSGTITKTGTSGLFYCYYNFASASGTATTSNNNFSNISNAAGTSQFIGLRVATNTTQVQIVNNNTINNVQTGSSAANIGIQVDYFIAASQANNNVVSNMTTTGSLYGIALATTTPAAGSATGGLLQGNKVYGLSASGASSVLVGMVIWPSSTATGSVRVVSDTVYNLSVSGNTSPVVRGIQQQATGLNDSIYLCQVYNLSATTTSGSATVNGITVNGGTTPYFFRNNIYNLDAGTSAGTSTSVQGINFAGGATTFNVYNNFISDLKAGNASAGNAVIGINAASTGSTYRVYDNTIAIGKAAAISSTGADFGASGVFYPNSATTPLDLRANIIYINATPAGTGTVAALKRAGGTAATVPVNLAAASNNNIYYSPNATNSYLYSEGITVATTVNAYNLTNDPAFNTSCGAYKIFMSPREGGTFTENNLSAGPGLATFVPTGLSFAESNGQVITTPSITNDYAGTVRGTTPDAGALEFSGTGVDASGPNVSYTALPNTACLLNVPLNVTATDVSGVNITAGTATRLWYKKSTNLNVLPATNDNTTDGWKWVESASTSSPFLVTLDLAKVFGGVAVGDSISYFVTVQDNAVTPNVSTNSATYNTGFCPSTVALAAGAFPVTGAIKGFKFLTSLSGTVTVGPSGTYTTLSGASGLFAALNSSGIAGTLIAELQNGTITETGANALNPIVSGCAGTGKLIIRPASGATVLLTGAVATPMLDINGADSILIDGSNNGTSSKDLTIRNTNTSGPTIRLINDATGNNIKNCIVEGGNTSSTSGVIVFSTAATGTLGNSGNRIDNCFLRDRSDATGVPANAVYSAGTATAPNAADSVTNCDIFNHTLTGVLVSATGAGNGWYLSQNSVYQTAARTTALTGLSLQGGSGHKILNNYIGGTTALAGGTNLATSSTFTGIALGVGTVSATSVQGNVVKNIRSTTTGFTASYGINLTSGMANIGDITGNYIGSANVAERFEINGDSYGISVSSTSSVNVSNNTVNNMGTNAAPSTGEYYFGINVAGTGGTHTVVNNTVMNVYNTSVPDASFNTQMIGLIVQATGVQVVRGNTIHEVGNNSGVANPSASFNNLTWGIIISATAVGTVVEKNYVYNIYGSSSTTGARADLVIGIQGQALANAVFSNNMVSLNGGNGASDRTIYAYNEISATPTVANYYFNSANVYGTASAANNSYGFNRNGSAVVNVKDNIFSNVRTGGTGFHVAIANTNATATGWSPTASNFNVLYSANPATLGQWLGAAAANNRTFAGWQALQSAGTPGSGDDSNSVNLAPVFNSNIDLHLTTANCGIDGRGTPIAGITTDIDNATRDAGAPDMGADEFTAPTGTVLDVLTPGTDSTTYNVSPSGTVYSSTGCTVIARILPSGATPVSGLIKAKVTVDPSVQFYNTEPYVQRHYDLEPAVNPAAATATVTLYFLQSEFDAFNTASGIYPDLPATPSDPNIANVHVTQYHGVGTAPGNYPGPAELLIPTSVVWNATNSWWEVTVTANGFSGFYVNTGPNVIPVTLLNFTAQRTGKVNVLNWSTSQEINTKQFVIEHSTDGRTFNAIGQVTAAGNSSTARNYTFTHSNPVVGINYYRLRIVDKDNNFKNSLVRSVRNEGIADVAIYPNPVKDMMTVSISADKAGSGQITITDVSGKLIYSKNITVAQGANNLPVNLDNIASGTYMIKVQLNDDFVVKKFNKL